MPQAPASAARSRRPGVPLLAAVVLLAGIVYAGIRLANPATVVPPAAASANAADPAQQIALLQDRVASDPTDAPAWQQLAVALTTQAAQTGDTAFYALAQDALAQAQRVAPDDLGTGLAEGNLLLSLHRFPEALALARELVADHPRSPEAHTVLVDALVEMGQYDEAARATQALLDLRPALPALARASYQRQLHGDLLGALLAMQEAETAGAGSPGLAAEVGVLLGDLASRRGDLELAAAAYDRALRVRPELVAGLVGRARLRAVEGDTAGAIAQLASLVERVPAPTALFELLGLQQAADRDEDASATAEVLAAVLSLAQAGEQVVDLEFALFEADHGDPGRAVELARAAHRVRPDNVFVQDALAWSLFRSGQVEQAARLTDQALRLGTLDPLLRWHAAAIHEAAGDPDRARALLREAFDVGPWSHPASLPAVAGLADRLGLTVPLASEGAA